MLKKFALVSVCGLLASACVVVDDDDDTTSTTASTATATAGTTTTSGDTDDATTDDSTTTDASTTDGTTSEGTDGGSTGGMATACGWGSTGQQDVPMGYVCDGDGADPDGTFAMACPDGFDLSVGADCIQDIGGTDVELSGIGCCDSDGNVWFCESDGTPSLNTELCE